MLSVNVSRRRALPLVVVLVLTAPVPRVFALEDADPARFEKAIAAFEEADKASPPPEGGTVFTGASNIRRWESLGSRFKTQKVLNRGFGGSHMSDVAFFAERTVIAYKPKAVYVNAGGNDLHAGKSPQDVLASFDAFVKKVKPVLPKAKLSLISIPPSPSRWSEVERVKEANALLAAYCAKDGDIDFIDTFSLLLGDDGKPRPGLYVEDQLHFNEAGYDIVTSAIKWQGAINALVKLDAAAPPPAGPIVFVGSSSIVKWKTLAEDFPGLPVMNRGFGGSEVFDSVTYAHRIVIPYRPRQIVFYAGGNDINAGKTPERVFTDFKAFVARVRAKLPDVRVSFISVAGNPKRWSQVEQVRALNGMVETWARTQTKMDFINVFPHMMGPDGTPKPDIFVSDQLHMNEKGYAIWKEVVAPFLR
ncbi:MAG: hypothetical protein K1X78_03830 [Verrucomicrobiaceae bacterium]|nr:hypothetical protein [Verrucomicrobiaceae bacterium]